MTYVHTNGGTNTLFSLSWILPTDITRVPNIVDLSVLSAFSSTCTCPNSTDLICGNAGICSEHTGVCICDLRTDGPACDQLLCKQQECIDSAICDESTANTSFPGCGGVGTCVNGGCTGCGAADATQCATVGQPCVGNGLCSMQGSCTSNGCLCDPGYFGRECELQECSQSSAMRPGLKAIVSV